MVSQFNDLKKAIVNHAIECDISIPSAGKLAEEIAIAIEADVDWEESLVSAVKTEIRAHLNGEDFK